MSSEHPKEESNSPQIPPTKLEDVPPSILAISNLRLPSPPPILNNGKSGKPSVLSSPPVQTSVVEKDFDPRSSTEPNSLSPKSQFPATVTEQFVYKNGSETSLDYLLFPPKDNAHHKAPSVHAHFSEETPRPVKLLNRSRSGSGSSNTRASPGLISGDASRSQENMSAKSVGSASSLVSSGKPSASGTPLPVLGPNEQNANIDPRLAQDDGKIHVLLGVCGALSAVKIKLIISKLYEIYGIDKISIQLILTKASENFISQEMLAILETVKRVRIWRDEDEWTWKTRQDPVLHIELRRWADILVICPLTANTLSKISLGICDNLLTNVIRAWNTSFPILLAPAMVSYSYNAITTKRQLKLIAEEMPWIEILKPLEKVVGSYGDIGMGGMMDWNEIVNRIVMKLGGYPEDEEEEEEEEGEDNSKENNDEAIIDDDEDEDDEDDDEDDEGDDDEDVDDEEEDEIEDENEEAAPTNLVVKETPKDDGSVQGNEGIRQ